VALYATLKRFQLIAMRVLPTSACSTVGMGCAISMHATGGYRWSMPPRWSRHAVVVNELMRMKLLSSKGEPGRANFEREPVYFASDATW
jgi:hypothetical protein